jgi:hypothetical protein
MLDTIVERIGEENDVHVINDNIVNYKATRQLLMEKRKKSYFGYHVMTIVSTWYWKILRRG